MQTIKILFVVNGLPSKEFKYTGIFNVQKLHKIAEQGYHLAFHKITSRSSLKGIIKETLKLRKKLIYENWDIVHAQYGSSTALICSLAKTKSTRLVINFGGDDLLGTRSVNGRKTFSSYISILFSQISAIFADGIVTVSKELREALWPISRNKTEVIPDGVDMEKYCVMEREEARQRLGWPLEKPFVLFCNSHSQPVKRLDLALLAIKEAQKYIPELDIKLLYNIDPDETPIWFNAVDLLLVTSDQEGSPNVVKEAMACNLPVVTVECGDVRERLKGVDNCVIVDRDPRELGSAIAKVLNSKKRSERGREKVSEVSWTEVVIKITKYYEEVLEK